MSRTINVDVFDPASIEAAVRELREYARWVEKKTTELRTRVAELIRKQAQDVFNTSVADNRFRVDENDLPVDESVMGGVDVTVQEDGDNVTLVIANGKDAVFIEFGAGVYYNGSVGSSPNPLGSDLGYTIGSYGLGNGRKQTWGFKGEDGEVHLSHGVPATMPLYRAMMSVVNDIVDIAREVFSS